MSLSPWAKRRKLIYTAVSVGVLLVVVVAQGFRSFYKAPTCFDSRQNGGESGVDCGGSCARLCVADVRPLKIQWVEHFKIRDGEYSAVAHIENPNGGAGVKDLPYVFRFIDASGNVLQEVSGTTYAEPNSSFPIFVGPLFFNREPNKVEFEIEGEPYFVRDSDNTLPLVVENSTLLSSESNPKISALVQNTSISAISDITAVAVVYDGTAPIAASKTDVEYLQSGNRERITFTWPDAFKVEPSVCAQPVSAVLAIDRSGSMNDDGGDPPQPITDVLNAAQTFVSNLKEGDKVGVVSYATNASNPIDMSPTFDIQSASSTLSAIEISEEDETGYTNPGEALLRAREALLSEGEVSGARENIIVLLTDGQANYPEDPGGEEYAESEAALTKREGIKIYTIGLGENINRQFLGRVATAPEYYFEAASTEDLEGIYEEIGTAVCSLGPSIIEITPRYNTFNVQASR